MNDNNLFGLKNPLESDSSAVCKIYIDDRLSSFLENMELSWVIR